MNRYALVGMWIVALLISGWLFQFALSDFYWPKPRRMFEAPDYVQEGNPFRPIFRACFGVVMITLVMIAAIVVTARAKSR
ncbi:MAG: hypothetical protein MI807_03660 [Verrucomicrobiales bacterium]|nr:hypothetical protein [Verrucomicrobiales bacterium]